MEFTAPLWSSPEAEWPISACGTIATRASTAVHASPAAERTARVSEVTTAAITVTTTHAWPTEMSCRNPTSPEVKDALGSSGTPARSE